MFPDYLRPHTAGQTPGRFARNCPWPRESGKLKAEPPGWTSLAKEGLLGPRIRGKWCSWRQITARGRLCSFYLHIICSFLYPPPAKVCSVPGSTLGTCGLRWVSAQGLMAPWRQTCKQMIRVQLTSEP